MAEAPGASGSGASGSGAAPAAPAAPQLTLDECRDAFYVAQRACERYAAQLKAFVEVLDSKKAQAGEAWIEAVQDESRKAALFHENQAAEWEGFSERADAYVESVRRLAELMAIAELKGETLEEAELPENRARTVHPELQKFKLEKRSRILGKIGGVPALGPGMAMPQLPSGGAALRATGSAAAREITWSKAEGKDARYLADVFQFKGGHVKRPDTVRKDDPAEWQQEASVMLRRRAQAEKTEEELRKTLASPFGEELTGVLQQRHKELKEKELEAEAVAASAFLRSKVAKGEEAGGLADATPELAQKLARRQEEAARAAKEAAERAAEEERAAAEGGAAAPGWHNAAAPFGGELAAALQRRNAAKAEAAKAAVPKEERPSASGGPPEDSELAKRFRKLQGQSA